MMNKVLVNDADKVPLQFKYFHFIATFFVISFIISNLLAVKISSIGYFDFPAGMVTFPLSYIFSDILTEVYGFQRARQLLYFAIFCELFVYFSIELAVYLPPANFWHNQSEFQTILLPQSRIIIASCIAYFMGDYVNNKFISKQKIKYGNNLIFARFIGSTALGVLVDNATFTLLAYAPIFIHSLDIKFTDLFWLVGSQYLIKVSYETLMSPFSVKFCLWLKKQEKVDVYDINTNFSIFQIKIDESKHINRFNDINETTQ